MTKDTHVDLLRRHLINVFFDISRAISELEKCAEEGHVASQAAFTAKNSLLQIREAVSRMTP